jgi:hypothetical protein
MTRYRYNLCDSFAFGFALIMKDGKVLYCLDATDK